MVREETKKIRYIIEDKSSNRSWNIRGITMLNI